MGKRKFKLRRIKNAEKNGSLVVAIPRAKVNVPVAEGLTLSLPAPEIIYRLSLPAPEIVSPQPVQAPDHSRDNI